MEIKENMKELQKITIENLKGKTEKLQILKDKYTTLKIKLKQTNTRRVILDED